MLKHTIVLLLPALLAASLSAHAAPQPIERLEASVNSSLILLSDVRKFKQTLKLRAQLDPLFAGTAVATKGENASAADVVDFLINERVIASAFPVTDAEVETEINSIQTNNHIDRQSLKSALADQGFTFEDYFELIRASVSKKNLIDRDIRTKVTISDDDVKNYYYNNYTRAAGMPVAYHLEMITVHTKNYKDPKGARDVAQRAYEAIKGGEVFEEVAKRSSDDASAQAGGDLGTMSDDQISPLIKEQLKGMKIGEISPVFGSFHNGGFFILKLVDLKSSDQERYDKMKDEIRNQLYAADYQHQINLWIERQRQAAFIHRSGEVSIAGLPAAK